MRSRQRWSRHSRRARGTCCCSRARHPSRGHLPCFARWTCCAPAYLGVTNGILGASIARPCRSHRAGRLPSVAAHATGSYICCCGAPSWCVGARPRYSWSCLPSGAAGSSCLSCTGVCTGAKGRCHRRLRLQMRRRLGWRDWTLPPRCLSTDPMNPKPDPRGTSREVILSPTKASMSSPGSSSCPQ